MSDMNLICLTGATGNMGVAGVKAILETWPDIRLRLLVLPDDPGLMRLGPWIHDPRVSIFRGHINHYDEVSRFVAGATYVIHLAALVSPLADHHPQEAVRINIGGTRNIVRSIQNSPDWNRIRLIYVGSIAQTGDRMPPLHWGRIGDPIKPSYFDMYAVTKAQAEKSVVESGLPYWVSLRQTGIAHPGLLSVRDGIIFHQPLENCMEWVSTADSGRLLAHALNPDLPVAFWKQIYNIGGGPEWRLTGYELLETIYRQLGVKDFRHFFDRSWFATQNFHGHWYLDSDTLNDLLHFRHDHPSDFLQRLPKEIPASTRFGCRLPASWVKSRFIKPLARSPMGPLNWIETHRIDMIQAFFGSKAQQEALPDWDQYTYQRPSNTPIILSHGFDESIPPSAWTLLDLQEAARFRGGYCHATDYAPGHPYDKIPWECNAGHRFLASPFLILQGGYWCPHCMPPPWDYDQIAKHNPFFAQVWRPTVI